MIRSHIDSSELAVQSTARGVAYSKFRNSIMELKDARDPRERAPYDRAVASLMKQLGIVTDQNGRIIHDAIMPATVHTNKFMTDLSVKYANDEYIGERLMPVVEVSKRSDSFVKYDERQTLNAPDAETGPDGDVNEVTRGRSTDNYSVKDWALKDRIPVETLDNQDEVFNEFFDMVEDLTDSVLLLEEIRIAAIVMATSSYASGQTHNATTKWDQASGGSIVTDLLTAGSEIWSGGGRTKKIGVCGIAVWNVIANNAAIKGLFQYVKDGLATPDAVARYFGFDQILVGRARQETANIGQTAAYSRIWATDNFAVLSVAERPTKRSAHFGSTFQHGGRKQNQWTDASKGPGSGVIFAKVGHSQDHKVVANKAGYIIGDVLS